MFGREPLTRSDAELLAQRFPYNGSTASRIFSIFGPVSVTYFLVLIVLGIVHHSSPGRLILPIVFVALGLPALLQRLQLRRKIRQTLARPAE
jgi:hypothetical protein